VNETEVSRKSTVLRTGGTSRTNFPTASRESVFPGNVSTSDGNGPPTVPELQRGRRNLISRRGEVVQNVVGADLDDLFFFF